MPDARVRLRPRHSGKQGSEPGELTLFDECSETATDGLGGDVEIQPLHEIGPGGSLCRQAKLEHRADLLVRLPCSQQREDPPS
jgi:hypothetical protein